MPFFDDDTMSGAGTMKMARTEHRPMTLAIVGCGAAAERCHIPAIPFAPDIQLNALVDPVLKHAARLAALHAELQGSTEEPCLASSVEELAGRVDLAIVAAPHVHHAELTIQLAELGIHVLVEKPMALAPQDCDRMAAAAGINRIVVGVAFVRRLFPASLWIKKIVERGQLGVIRRIRWWEGAPYEWPLVTPSLFVRDLAGGGVLTDGGSHVLDLILWWLGARDVDHIRYRDSALGGVESDALADLTIGNVEVSVELSRLRLLSNTCIIDGDEGSIEFGIDVDSPFTFRGASGRVVEKGIVAAEPPAQGQWERLFAEQLRNFAAAARGDEPIYAGAADGRAVTALIRGCYAWKERIAMPWREVQPW